VESGFPHPDYQVYVIALNDPTSDYWERYRTFWRTLSHNQAFKLQGDKEHIFRALHEVINNILGTSAQHISPDMYDNVVIPPYLESVVFDIFRVNPEVKVDIFPADKPEEPLSPESENVKVLNVGKTIQTVTITNPVPGIWKFRKSHESAKFDIYTQRFFPRGKLLYPNPDQSIRQFEKVVVKYRVEDGNHNPIKELPGYPLMLELSLVKPDDSRIKMEMRKSFDSSEVGVFKTNREVECDLPGIYRTEVLIATKDLKNRQVTLFRDQWSKFQVKAANLIAGSLVSPRSMENIPIFGTLVLIPKSLRFKFKFVYEDGNTVNLPAFFQGPPGNILAILSVRGNTEHPVPLECEQQENGILVCEVKGLGRLGQHHLRFLPNNASVPPQYTIRITPDHLFFNRSLTLFHWMQIFILGLLLLFLMVFWGYKFYVNTRFPLKGTLYIDRLGDRSVDEYPLGGKRHRLSLKQCPNETKIKKIYIRAKRDKSGGIMVTVIGDKKKIFLKDRALYDRGTAILRDVPYVLRYRLK
jgi:hypothetical protein